MWFKRLSLAALAAASSQLALASPASSVLQFEGAVKGTTCSISVGGVEAPNPATVILEPVNLENLRKGWTNFNHFDIDLKNCAGVATKANAIFQSAHGTIVTDGNRLENMATSNPAKHVRLGIFMKNADSNSYTNVVFGSATPGSSHWIGIGEERLRLIADYRIFTWDVEKVTAGNFEAAMQFTVLYQ